MQVFFYAIIMRLAGNIIHFPGKKNRDASSPESMQLHNKRGV